MKISDLTNAERMTAIRNGVEPTTLYKRLKSGWDVERAITAPRYSRKEESVYTQEELNIAHGNGISTNILNKRLTYGWDVERAIATPVSPKGKHPRETEYSKWKEDCEKNNVSYSTFIKRLEYGWKPERSATTPPMYKRRKKSQKGG